MPVDPTIMDNLATFSVLVGSMIQCVKQLADNNEVIEIECPDEDSDDDGGSVPVGK